MVRVRKPRRALPSAIALLAAAPAAASEGLEIFPDVPSAEHPVTALVVQLVLFALLIWPANRLLWRPLLGVLEQRRDRIAGNRARAEKVAADAEDVLGEYQSSVEHARRSAESDRATRLEGARREQAQLTAEARKAAEAEVAAARETVAAALGRARGELQAAAEQLGREAAARVLGRPLS
jgi:F-type H+-transporting ATPase subunit b